MFVIIDIRKPKLIQMLICLQEKTSNRQNIVIRIKSDVFKDTFIVSNIVPEGNDGSKASASIEFLIFHYWYFLDNQFRFRSSVCNDCDDELKMSIDIYFENIY